MIVLTRLDRRSIRFDFDESGARELLGAFQALRRRSETGLLVELDPAVVTRKKASRTTKLMLLLKIGEGRIQRSDEGILWELEEDDVDYGARRFEECLAEGCFSPPEFVQVSVGESKALDYVYGALLLDGRRANGE